MIKTCIFCGKEVNTKDPEYSEDHVPSKMLFPKGFSIKNPIKVPAHKLCNNSFAKDEEWFRIFLVNLSQEKSFLANQLFWTKIKRSIEKNPSIGKKILSKMEIVDYFKSGIYLGKKTAIHVSDEDWERYYNVLDKFAKGLFYFHLGERLESYNFVVKHKTIDQNLLKPEFLSTLKFNFENEPVFLYGISSVPETKHTAILMTFFGGIHFVSFITSEEKFLEFENKKYSKENNL